MYQIEDMRGMKNPGMTKPNRAAVEAGTRRGADLHSPRGEEMGLTPRTGLTIGLPCNLSTRADRRRWARSQVRRPMTIGTRHGDHTTFNVIIVGCGDIFAGIVREGNGEI
jgi:hypothetical protein